MWSKSPAKASLTVQHSPTNIQWGPNFVNNVEFAHTQKVNPQTRSITRTQEPASPQIQTLLMALGRHLPEVHPPRACRGVVQLDVCGCYIQRNLLVVRVRQVPPMHARFTAPVSTGGDYTVGKNRRSSASCDQTQQLHSTIEENMGQVCQDLGRAHGCSVPHFCMYSCPN